MRNTKKIPFYANPDGMSCGQCTYKMMLEYFEPDKERSFMQMNALCGATPNKYTWVFKPAVEVSKLGYEVIVYNSFSAEKFLLNPKKYLISVLSEEGANDAISNSDIPTTLRHTHKYIEYKKNKKFIENRKNLSVKELRYLLDQNYLINLWVNSASLNDLEGFTGHFVLLHGYDNDGFYINDPGSSLKDAEANKFITNTKLLESIKAFADGSTGETVAIRKKNA